jgi:hypothetical protein
MTTPQGGTNETESPPVFRKPTGRTAAPLWPRKAEFHAAYKELAVVRAHTTGEQEGTGSGRRLPRVGLRLRGAASCGTC